MSRKKSFCSSCSSGKSSANSSETYPLIFVQPKSYGSLVASYEFYKFSRNKEKTQ
ncbi:hypothetical protein HHI36_007926, partial [Cryptolaemus montrouzieri]